MGRNLFDEQINNTTNAYNKALYYLIDPDIILKVGENSKSLDQYLWYREASSITIMTGFNPFSQIATAGENRRNQFHLQQLVQSLELPFTEGINIDPKGDFPNEYTIGVFDMAFYTGIQIARTFRQRAIFYYPFKGEGRLVWCKSKYF
ncbi:DUF3293 domain-containing protein [Membranihabitans maritimus]|uniref:DUF3293 domain-containing protein n=1 Tax=Membranihabitans maritimus TaxID=2904244 RepID=UPI001F3D5F1A|nr:DUF3293 domain-containing protein [Membranihabitans maritimus]